MCLGASCGVFFQPGVGLERLKCPSCGYGYWDMFQERFVPHYERQLDHLGRAMPMEDEEMQAKGDKTSEEFESSMRAQFILHCIGEGLKARLDDDRNDVGFDEPNLLRALTELLEISRGDFTSHGASASTLPIRTSAPARSRAETAPQLQGDPLQAHRSYPSESPSGAGNRPDITASSRGEVPSMRQGRQVARFSNTDDDIQRESHQRSATEQSHRSRAGINRSGRAAISPRHGGTMHSDATARDVSARHNVSETARIDSDNDQDEPRDDDDDEDDDEEESENEKKHTPTRPVREESARYGSQDDDGLHTQLLPVKGINQETLEYYGKKGIFGTWTKISRIRRNGKDFYSIECTNDTKQLTADQIEFLIRQSSLLEDEKHKKASQTRYGR